MSLSPRTVSVSEETEISFTGHLLERRNLARVYHPKIREFSPYRSPVPRRLFGGVSDGSYCRTGIYLCGGIQLGGGRESCPDCPEPENRPRTTRLSLSTLPRPAPPPSSLSSRGWAHSQRSSQIRHHVDGTYQGSRSSKSRF